MGVLSPELVVAATLVHCTLQGILIPLFVSFLTSQRDRSKWFTTYVVTVNLIALAETVIHLVPLPDILNRKPPRLLLLLGPQLATELICASVQAFFIFRCWRIFQRRLLPLVPFLCLYLTGIITGIIVLVELVESVTDSSVLGKLRTVYAIWMFSLFFLDLSMTITTIVFLFRACAGNSGRDSVSSTVWQVIWASAVPPLVVMAVPLVNQFVVKSPIHPVTVFPIAMSGKFFVLSLMISLVGRGYIREKFNQLARGSEGQSTTFGLGVRDAEQSGPPAFAERTSIVYELEGVRRSANYRSTRASSDVIQMQLHVKNPGEVSQTDTSSTHSQNNKTDPQ